MSTQPSLAHALPIRSYLDETVMPLLMRALAALAQQSPKPENPFEYIAHYLKKHNPQEKVTV